MRPFDERRREQLEETYRRMTKKARYYPAAPSDGVGNIIGEIDVEAEAEKYAEHWWTEESSFDFFVGCCNFRTRPATVFAIEAARQMCGGDGGNITALALLKMAVADLEKETA